MTPKKTEKNKPHTTVKRGFKQSLQRLAVSLLAAFITLYTAIYFLSAPRLGAHYDFLMWLRPKLQVQGVEARGGGIPAERAFDQTAARGILLIETGGGADGVDGAVDGENVIASSTVFVLMMALAEMGAASLLIETPVLGVSGGHALSDAEIIYHFDEEFNVVESNIRNLFDGIRLGSIAPFDASRYVNDVIRLTEQGKNRLLSAAVRGGEEQSEQLENAAAIFDAVYIPGDLMVDVIRPETGKLPLNRLSRPVYSRPPPDRDGKIRRIAPVLNTGKGAEYEYAAYTALKKGFSRAQVRPTNDGFALALGGNVSGGNAPATDEQIFKLDSNAALLFGIPEGGLDAFRKIELALFLEYSEADRMLYRLLAETPALAQYADISVENYPPFLYEQSRILRETLLENPELELRERWKQSLGAYYDSLDKFFDKDNGAEVKITFSFDKLIEQENLDDAGRERLETLRDEQLEMLSTARELYNDVSALRKKLSDELSGSFCILGTASRSTELSVMFANSIMTGNYIIPANIKQILFSSTVIILILMFLMCKMSIISSFCFCVLMTALTITGFSYNFIASGLWIDPFIPGSAAAAGSLVSSLFALSLKKRSEIRLRHAYGNIVNEVYLKKIIKNAESLPEKKVKVKSAIVMVRRPDLTVLENSPDAKKTSLYLQKFRAEVCSILIKAGGVIIGCEGERVGAAFGSPLERFVFNKTGKKEKKENNPAGKASSALSVLFDRYSFPGKLYAGIDYGECVFEYTPLTGYTACGSAVFRSRILSKLAHRNKISVLISKAASGHIAPSAIRGVPASGGADGKENELYYQLLLKEI
ncbi:MAG: hypothetical protein LBB22_01045 [Treponema sp.]|jgi:hypothetical protein|nr:hypothetical protein [Treponema sp.]